MSLLLLLKSSAVSYTLTAASGTYVLTGAAATLRRGYVLVAASRAFVLSGQAATLKHGYNLAGAPGSYALTGTAATLRRGYVLAAIGGALTIAGQAVTLRRGYRLSAESGAYALAGQSANLVYTPNAVARTLVAESGSFTLTGQAAVLTYTPNAAPVVASGGAWAPPVRRVDPAPRVHTVVGQPAELIRGYRLQADGGIVERWMLPAIAPVRQVPRAVQRDSFVVVPVVLAPATVAAPALPIVSNVYQMHAGPSQLTLAGGNVTLRHGRRLIAEPVLLDPPQPPHPFTDDDMLAVLLLLAA